MPYLFFFVDAPRKSNEPPNADTHHAILSSSLLGITCSDCSCMNCRIFENKIDAILTGRLTSSHCWVGSRLFAVMSTFELLAALGSEIARITEMWWHARNVRHTDNNSRCGLHNGDFGSQPEEIGQMHALTRPYEIGHGSDFNVPWQKRTFTKKLS